VFDTNDFSLIETLHFEMEKDEYMFCFNVMQHGNTRRIFAIMETNQSPDIQIVELVE
jgi:hypothetical protein